MQAGAKLIRERVFKRRELEDWLVKILDNYQNGFQEFVVRDYELADGKRFQDLILRDHTSRVDRYV